MKCLTEYCPVAQMIAGGPDVMLPDPSNPFNPWSFSVFTTDGTDLVDEALRKRDHGPD
ncbi:MAG TPA: hypothetical protein PLW35_03460 [Verrucomicrobiota bacterium]|nr:hypothetical protein [Verrucomicrobiota bacterium]